MAKKKIQNDQEVERWIREGKTYTWMVEEYERKYNIEIQPHAFANFRKRRGIDLRVQRDDRLIPWRVKEEHRWAYPLSMLRTEAKVRRGETPGGGRMERLENWKKKLLAEDLVVKYDPDTDAGFTYVRRRPDIDKDLIFEPEVRDGMVYGDHEDREEGHALN